MKTLIWEVEMSDRKYPRTVVNHRYNVRAADASDALAKAEKLEQQWADEMSDDGEPCKPCIATAVSFVCEVHG